MLASPVSNSEFLPRAKQLEFSVTVPVSVIKLRGEFTPGRFPANYTKYKLAPLMDTFSGERPVCNTPRGI